MKIAVTYENGEVFQHFGHTENFMIYQIDGDSIASSKMVSAAETGGHGALAGFLQQQGVDKLICGGIGGGARSALNKAGIQIYPGASGNADECVKALINGSLSYDPDTICSHHSAEGHEHSCNHSGGGHEHSCH